MGSVSRYGPGVVTGFLRPNGAGKSTTMRLLLGLDAPDTGEARIGGRRYRELFWPLREVGALLEARVREVLDMVGNVTGGC